MEGGSSSKPPAKAESVRTGKRLGSMLPNIEPFVPKTDHNPRELRSARALFLILNSFLPF